MKILNKALFYKEWINVRWITVLTVFILLYYKLYGVISALNLNKFWLQQHGVLYSNRWFNNGIFASTNYNTVMICTVIVLSIILFVGEKNSETQGFIASMPFTRKEIILNKWFVGAFSIIVSFVVVFIFLSMFYVANLNALDAVLNPYSDLVKWFFIDTMQYVCIFTFSILIQTVMGNSIVSGIVGGIILFVPFFMISIIQEIVMRISHYNGYNPLISTLSNLQNWLNITIYNFAYQQWYKVENTMGNTCRNYYYINYELKLTILFILTLIFLYLAYIAYKKRNLEYNLRLLAFKNLELVFIVSIAICSGFLVGAILGFGQSNGSLSAFWAWAIFGTIGGYFMAKVLVKILSSAK